MLDSIAVSTIGGKISGKMGDDEGDAMSEGGGRTVIGDQDGDNTYLEQRVSQGQTAIRQRDWRHYGPGASRQATGSVWTKHSGKGDRILNRNQRR